MSEGPRIGTAAPAPGTVAHGGIPVGTDLRGIVDEIPVIVCRGAEDGPTLWLNGATHGDEPEGAFSIFKLLELVDPQRLRGTIVGVPAMNVPAFAAGTRGDPTDTFSYDMNRVYPGRADGYPTERAAWAHWEAMQPSCDLQIAIHSGGDHSYLAHMIFASDNPQSPRARRRNGDPLGPRLSCTHRCCQPFVEDRRRRKGGNHHRIGRQLPFPDA